MPAPIPLIVEVTGSGSGIVGEVIYPATYQGRGRLQSVVVRQDTGGGATVLDDLVFVHNIVDLDLTATPPQEHVLTLIQNVALTASATSASLSTTIDNPQCFAKGFAVSCNVTASGAWTLKLGLVVEEF